MLIRISRQYNRIRDIIENIHVHLTVMFDVAHHALLAHSIRMVLVSLTGDVPPYNGEPHTLYHNRIRHHHLTICKGTNHHTLYTA